MYNKELLDDKAIAILATNGFEEIELSAPFDELSNYGATVHIVSNKPIIRSWKNKQWSNEFKTDRLLNSVDVKEYDMLILPGGVINADQLRRNEKAIDLIKNFYNANKFIAAVCHGPQLLIEADLVKERTLTAHHALKTDLKNAGANYEDFGVLRDDRIISAQGTKDVSSLLKKIIGILKVEKKKLLA